MEKNTRGPNIVKLNSQNYSIWKTLMEEMLYSKDLYNPVEGDKSKGTKSDAEWKKLNWKVVALIRQWLDLSMYPHVETKTNVENMWNKLKELYERKNVQYKAFLIRKLVNMKYIKGKSIPEHLSIFQEAVNQLTNNEITLNDKLQALLLLSYLPDSWEVLVVTLTNSTPNRKLTLAMVKDSILNEKAKRRERGLTNASSQSEALVSESRRRSQSRKPHSSDKSESRSKSRGKYKLRKEFICYHCGKSGHIKRIWDLKLEKMVPKTPQHNGVVERMNHTINDRVRCMLSHARLPKSFWGEAMRAAVDLINLSPSVPLNGDVPENLWRGKDVSYSHL
ncbi:uncharacterized protein [Arachis hypogaea]|uniref:uncharacterized protein n=1 Tax=Arachis hypogaea TaxID=3818 RepID=UPI003B226000